MKSLHDDVDYNERIFTGGVRRYLHTARFRWLNHELARLQCSYDSILELGCFDGKLLDFLPTKPTRYKGFDANWEGGLTLAQTRWRNEPGYEFYYARVPDDMELGDGE